MKWLAVTKYFWVILWLILNVMVVDAKTSRLVNKTKTDKIDSEKNSFKPEVLSAKAFLEDLLVRRYSQDLSTKVEKSFFSIGAQLDLIETPNEKKDLSDNVESEPISDLMLGTIDPEELLKRYGEIEGKDIIKNFLDSYKIKTLQISVGLNENLSEEVKSDVENWLKNRLKLEFGSAGKGLVSLVKVPAEKPLAPKSLLDLLEKFQSLAGQLVLALAVIIGILLWKLLTSSKPSQVHLQGETQNQNISQSVDGEGNASKSQYPHKFESKEDKAELTRLNENFEKLRKQLNDLTPRLIPHIESVVRTWCASGESGRIKLACFAEAVGKEIGKLPIPVDALSEVTKVFSKMIHVGLKEKCEVLEKAYWDLLSTLNLGPESLAQPFGYLGGLNMNLINQVLLDQNPKAQTVVSLFMPQDLRQRYISNLSEDVKRQLLQTASSLSEIPTEELKSLDSNLMNQLKPSTGKAEVISLELTLSKIVEALTPREEVVLLSELKGPMVKEFKRSYPTLSFLNEWSDEALSFLLSKATSNELVALLRVRSDLSERIIKLAPPMSAEMIEDELSRTDTMSDKDKDHWIDFFRKRLKNMVELKEINLEEIFKESKEDTHQNHFPQKVA